MATGVDAAGGSGGPVEVTRPDPPAPPPAPTPDAALAEPAATDPPVANDAVPRPSYAFGVGVDGFPTPGVRPPAWRPGVCRRRRRNPRQPSPR